MTKLSDYALARRAVLFYFFVVFGVFLLSGAAAIFVRLHVEFPASTPQQRARSVRPCCLPANVFSVL